jgi:hypothetical protein
VSGAELRCSIDMVDAGIATRGCVDGTVVRASSSGWDEHADELRLGGAAGARSGIWHQSSSNDEDEHADGVRQGQASS